MEECAEPLYLREKSPGTHLSGEGAPKPESTLCRNGNYCLCLESNLDHPARYSLLYRMISPDFRFEHVPAKQSSYDDNWRSHERGKTVNGSDIGSSDDANLGGRDMSVEGQIFLETTVRQSDRLCGLVVRVPGC
jgi:hypothetical protein